MAKKRIVDDYIPTRPVISPDNEEMKLINLAMKTAERQMKEGTASSQVITHFLKLGTEQAKLERAKLEKEIALLDSKKVAIEQSAQSERMFTEAIEAMQRYSGSNDNSEEEL